MIGKNIVELRKKRGYTLSELSKLTNISKSYLSNIERNINNNPSLEVMQKIAKVLKVDILTLSKTIPNQDAQPYIEKEWIDFINELKKMGLEKDQLHQYIILIEFINWKNQHSKQNNF
ncbi:helix-turn-helix domain-containing protein [Heyndrickxia oleronia]|uniref:Helix-turn-helix transcriptional regulator n=1 Tax=Heyndrickxia oleronia TaxID=38875 RepID=A0AAW6SR84_9BACI|nr:helix-turn-helix transcriptional regulator [Heyndrickxia oleronia]MCM3453721.1 helix-turn-helix domain-containing protein [Heyndrickxia oleronia]MDH5159342.1 helix-turn-helix transcriptional regulator [Heyndrickxia oleronia]OJH19383.1 transcriptional regulator [Bacillus obstructivus]